MEPKWNQLVETISNIIKLPAHIIDLISNMEVLELCARGRSLSNISITTGIPVGEVKEILVQCNMTFFMSNLSFDSLAFYEDAGGNRWEYIDHLCYLYPDENEDLLHASFDNAKTFTNYRKEIDAYYAN